MVYKVKKIDKPTLPLSAYAHQNFFKLYLCDVGLLRRMARLPASSILEKSNHYPEFKGAMAENFVLSEILCLSRDVPFYWKSGNTAEVDFIIQVDDNIIPIEVKASSNVRSRSLGVYRSKYKPRISLRASMRNLKKDNGLINIPLYFLWALKKILGSG
jgi:predicted AAA+ superfamily ATPase